MNTNIVRDKGHIKVRFDEILPREFFEDELGNLCVKCDDLYASDYVSDFYNAFCFEGTMLKRSFSSNMMVYPLKVTINVEYRC